MNSIYKKRRKLLASKLEKNSLVIIPNSSEKIRNRDCFYLYRPDSYFYYLTGFSEPNSCLVLDSEGNSIIFCQKKNIEKEIWDGILLGIEKVPETLGVNQAFSINDLDKKIPELLIDKNCIYFPFGIHENLSLKIENHLKQVKTLARNGKISPKIQIDICQLLDEMRLIKSEEELNLMRKAGKISAKAHIRAMQKSFLMLKNNQDLREFHLEAELLYEFRKSGADGVAYNNIVATGKNSCILHYLASDEKIKNGDLVLIDAGCELGFYASDITRTFPANGKFTSAQKDLYQLALDAQKASVDKAKIGNNFTDIHESSVKVLSQGLLDLKIIQNYSNVDDVIENQAYKEFYMHGTGHWLGLDVHDCGSYVEEINGKKFSKILQENMVLTIEPGLYIHQNEKNKNIPEKFINLGIRIEDNVIIKKNSCELITREVPVKADEIEYLMKN